MTKWLSLDHLRKIVSFLGRQVVRLLLLGIMIGGVLFIAEVAFAWGLQAFLIQLGVMSAQVIQLPGWIPQSSLSSVLVFIFCIGALRALLQWAQIYLQGTSYEHLRANHRIRVLKWAFNSESASSSRVSDLFTEQINMAALAVASVQTLTIQLTTVALLGITLLYISPLLTTVAGLALVLISIPLKSADARIKTTGRGLATEWSKTNRRLMMNINNLLLMQIYGTERDEETLAAEGVNSYRRHAINFAWISGLKYALPQVIGIFMLCFMSLAASSTDALTGSALISYFYLFIRLLQTFSLLTLNAANLMNYWPQLENISKWWADHSFDGIRNQRELETGKIQAAYTGPIGWKISGVSFRYPGAALDVVRDLTLTVTPGTALVVTGPSGAGKSTLLNLMLGGAVPGSGTLEILTSDGLTLPLKGERQRLRANLGYVGPESFLIEDSIYKNITYGLRAVPSTADIEHALKLAECHFVHDLSGGLDYQITEQGQGLSAGQKQRLSLARALLRKPNVLILDEPTANLDEEIEAKLVETFLKLKAQTTIIAVSHQPALMKIADQHLQLKELQP